MSDTETAFQQFGVVLLNGAKDYIIERDLEERLIKVFAPSCAQIFKCV